MATPSEQKALAFLAMIVLLGGVVRVVRAGSPAGPSASEQQAIARQAASADSAAASPKGRKARAQRPARPRKAKSEPTVVGGVATVPPSSAAPPQLFAHDGFPPPSPRVDVDYRANRSTGSVGVTPGPKTAGAAREPLDLDRATGHQIEALPWVGPALARRIVANRDSFGTFGSLEALARVKGIGAATRKRLAALVTFSGSPSSRR